MRTVKNWADGLPNDDPETATIAPDRYHDGSEVEPELYYKEKDAGKRFRSMTAYKPGEVVWIERDASEVRRSGKLGDKVVARARVITVICEIRDRGPSEGFYIARYRVQFETKKGDWAKTWNFTYPGFISRGYTLAARNAKLTAEIMADEPEPTVTK